MTANGFIGRRLVEEGHKTQDQSPGSRLEIPRGQEADGCSSSSGESADELIEEAESFLAAVRESKEALVSVEEWSVKRSNKVCVH